MSYLICPGLTMVSSALQSATGWTNKLLENSTIALKKQAPNSISTQATSTWRVYR
ncbi:MAG: hypothetical protein N2235_16235 [Fischerella sp.]|nr:hypothetical protein [Fischerella sp.]